MSQPIDYERLAADYARHRGLHPGVLAQLLRHGRLTADAQALEVGCGTGNYIIALAEMTGCTAWGIDPSLSMLARARARSDRVRFFGGRAEQIGLPSASLDLIFSVDVIHHVADPLAYFQEAQRLLRPGGQLCTVTDSASIIRRRQPLSVYFPETVAVDLARYPRITTLRMLMARAGLRATRVERVELPYFVEESAPYRHKAFSALHLISEEAFRRGLARLEADFKVGPVLGVSRYLLAWGERSSRHVVPAGA